MLSQRGQMSAASLDIPWRFAPGGNNRYDPVTNPTGVVSFGTAENNLLTDELHNFVANKVSIPSLAYKYRYSTMGGPRFPQAMASHINRHFRPRCPIRAEHILTASGLTAIHKLVGESIGDPGDGILVSRPVYGRFELDFGNTSGLRMVYADLCGVDPFSEEAVGKYQEALDASKRQGVNVRAVLIVNPHNPLGRTYSAAVLKALAVLCEENDIHLISDEVYALSVYNINQDRSNDFVSLLSIDTAGIVNENRLHVFYGMSKDFGAAGLRLGCLITQNAELRRAVACNLRFHNPSGASIAIGTAILEDAEFVSSFIGLSRRRLKQVRDHTAKRLVEAGIQYHEKSNAGFFLFIDLSPWLDLSHPVANGTGYTREFVLAQKLLDGGVGLHPCEEHAEKEGRFRLVFSQEKNALDVGLDRLFAVLRSIDEGRAHHDESITV